MSGAVVLTMVPMDQMISVNHGQAWLGIEAIVESRIDVVCLKRDNRLEGIDMDRESAVRLHHVGAERDGRIHCLLTMFTDG